MNLSEIDDALGSDPVVEPSAEFRSQVMGTVRARGISRPHGWLWRALGPVAAVASVIVALLIAAMMLERSEARPGDATEIVRWLSVSLTGTLAVAWRIAGRTRV